MNLCSAMRRPAALLAAAGTLLALVATAGQPRVHGPASSQVAGREFRVRDDRAAPVPLDGGHANRPARVALLRATAVIVERPVRVPPPVSRTAWFALLAAVGTGAAGYAAYRRRRRQLEARFALVLAERVRLAGEIHDTLLQGFTGVTLQLTAVSSEVEPAPARARVAAVLELARRTLVDARHAVWDLRAPALDGQPLADALRAAARRAAVAGGFAVEVVADPGPALALAPAAEGTLLRVAEEALANAARHAGATRVDVTLRYAGRGAELVVRDDGRGFEPARAEAGLGAHWGLVGMRERVARLGGRLDIRSAPGAGTEVRATVPAPKSSAVGSP